MDFNTTLDPVAVDDEQLSHHQINTLVLVERIGGTLSLISVMLIFITYWLVRRVRNVQNTFIVFASVSNIGASIGSIIAYDGMEAGQRTALCQAQSFMFEMFMQSDPWWSLAMAVNVFLVFYFHTNPDSFRKRWWIYCLICYGGPFVIALTLLLVRSPRGLVYGGATIWCWVDKEWDYIRIYTYYMLIWICIVGSILCYFLVGWHVFRMRNRLRSFSTSRNREKDREADQGRGETAHNGFYGTVTTEVQVTHTLADSVPPEPQPAYIPRTTRHVSFDNPEPEIQPSSDNQYYSSVTTAPPQEVPPPPSLLQRFKTTVTAITSKFRVGDPIKRAYLRTSFLFALSVLVTWIPSSLNRIHGWLDGGSPYEFHVATAAVLPLQGLWNGIIFFVTSWRSIKAWINETFKASAAVIDRHKADELGMNERTAGPLNPLNRCESFMDDGDSATIGSDVELRRVPNSGTKTAHPL
ncbi:G-protein coupled receptor protein [Trichoderma reesei QM6a]|uniref:G-protein coupled receptor protein n=2 Tax=Hypocrea jecorina TaxID=51453 RepID=G0RC27_HYPJQ|nr:G-protein coupled receptor protein [Trichoderma reesei QM6a]EGR51434.1 G-protein coupled receptor protein [Trichoderma reesei QM6a]ETS04609.1 G-protein coupled receptor [Trichoderma reesei RUT C-30]